MNGSRPDRRLAPVGDRIGAVSSEVVEITWVNALEQYFNAINVGLGIGSDGFCALPEPPALQGRA